MALVINDRVKETTTTTGTGAVSLGGAVTGFETFAAGIGNSNTVYYCIVHQTAAEFEVGLGTLDGDSSDLTRTTVISSSNSDSAVDFSAGTKDVFCTIPASKLIFEDANNDATIGRNLTVTGDLTITGDDITMNTNTSGAALIGDGTNFNPVAISGDITIAANGTAAIGSGVIVNADINSSAAIADSKLATISTAGKVDIGALEIDGATDIGGALADADLFIVDDGANGTERKMAASRILTYVGASAGAFSIANLDIDGGTDIGADLADADLFIVDDGAGGTNRKLAASRIATYVGASAGAFSIANLDIDGGTDIGEALADADLLVVDNGAGGTNRKMAASRLQTYIEGKISGDITISSGTAAIGSGVIVNADINSSAAIADSKLATISTAGKVDIGALEIDGATDIGADLADADLIIVDDGGGGTERKAALSRMKTYIGDPTALAIALG
jgi:prefoldin subunit 5